MLVLKWMRCPYVSLAGLRMLLEQPFHLTCRSILCFFKNTSLPTHSQQRAQRLIVLAKTSYIIFIPLVIETVELSAELVGILDLVKSFHICGSVIGPLHAVHRGLDGLI